MVNEKKWIITDGPCVLVPSGKDDPIYYDVTKYIRRIVCKPNESLGKWDMDMEIKDSDSIPTDIKRAISNNCENHITW